MKRHPGEVGQVAASPGRGCGLRGSPRLSKVQPQQKRVWIPAYAGMTRRWGRRFVP